MGLVECRCTALRASRSNEVFHQALGFAADHAVAFANAGFQTGAVKDGNAASIVSDQPGILQIDSLTGDGLTLHTEYVGDKLLRHVQLIGRQPVMAQKQPAAQLLLGGMVPVAGGGLRNLGNQSLRVAQHKALEHVASFKLRRHDIGGQTECATGALHNGAIGDAFPAHEQGYPQNAVIADKRDFGGPAVIHRVEQRYDGGGREINRL